MKQLPVKFTKRGFTFTLERRKEKAAIYRQELLGIDDPQPAYEVIIPRIDKTTFIDGKWQPCEPREGYPGSETWGTSGWTYTDLEDAIARYKALS